MAVKDIWRKISGVQTEVAYISPANLSRIIAQAEQAFPNECCGLLLGLRQQAGCQIQQVRPMRNVADRPQLGFTFDPREQLVAMREADAAGLEMLGHYHSHPNARSGPSPTDLKNARQHFDRGLWLILAIGRGKFLEASLWQLAGEPGEFVRRRMIVH